MTQNETNSTTSTPIEFDQECTIGILRGLSTVELKKSPDAIRDFAGKMQEIFKHKPYVEDKHLWFIGALIVKVNQLEKQIEELRREDGKQTTDK